MSKPHTVVPARGGSKGVPRKNLKSLGGKPLIAHQIEAALEASTVGTPIVSTDDEEIATAAREYGADVPFTRPEELATDDVPVIAAVKHCMEYVRDRGEEVEYVVCLQPTSPFTTAANIDDAVRMNCDSVVSVAKITETHPYRTYTLEEDRVRPLDDITVEKPDQRQDRPTVYGFTGAIYVRSADVLSAWDYDDFALGDDIRAIEQTDAEAFDIDTPFEFELARALQKYRTDS